MHEPKEQLNLTMDTIVKTCRYRHIFTALTSTFIKVLPVDGLYSVYTRFLATITAYNIY
jgi:hypothetical protein